MLGAGKRKESKLNKDLASVWENKLDQVCSKARLCFEPNSQDLNRLNEMAAELKQNAQKVKSKRTKRNLIIILSVVGFYVALYSILGIYLSVDDSKGKKNELKETQRLEQLYEEIKADISAGNYEDAELKFVDLKWSYNSDYSSQKQNVENWKEKKEVLQKQLEKKTQGEK